MQIIYYKSLQTSPLQHVKKLNLFKVNFIPLAFQELSWTLNEAIVLIPYFLFDIVTFPPMSFIAILKLYHIIFLNTENESRGKIGLHKSCWTIRPSTLLNFSCKHSYILFSSSWIYFISVRGPEMTFFLIFSYPNESRSTSRPCWQDGNVGMILYQFYTVQMNLYVVLSSYLSHQFCDIRAYSNLFPSKWILRSFHF